MSVQAVKDLEKKCDKSTELRLALAVLTESALRIRQQIATALEGGDTAMASAQITDLETQIATEISTFRSVCQSYGIGSNPFDMDDLCNAAAS